MVKPLLIIKAGEKLPTLQDLDGDFEDWILAGMQWCKTACIICPVYKGELLPGIDDICGVVITGSAAMVSDDLPWVEPTVNWLQKVVNSSLPVLGICFGHQLLAYALGGEVKDNPKGIEVGTVSMTVNAGNDPLFSVLPGTLNVQVSHQQSVLKLPGDARLMATTEMDAHHAFRFGDSAWGIQFHPEFDKAIVEKYVAFYQNQTGNKVKQNKLADTPEAVMILQQFAKLIRQ